VKEYVLDANALVRLFRDAPGASTVENLVRQSKAGRARLQISVVNLTEVAYVLARYLNQDKVDLCTQSVRPVVEPVGVDEQAALRAANLRTRYKLGLADCFAAELAMRAGATLVTADPEFEKLGKRLKILALPRHSA
jgi:predicted nucleic acid-binding protein